MRYRELPGRYEMDEIVEQIMDEHSEVELLRGRVAELERRFSMVCERNGELLKELGVERGVVGRLTSRVLELETALTTLGPVS